MTKAKAAAHETTAMSQGMRSRKATDQPRKRRARAAVEAAPIQQRSATKAPSKRDQLAALLIRDEGATIVQMQEVTGWLPHTVRAALTGLKKLGYALDSDKIDGVRTYRAVTPR